MAVRPVDADYLSELVCEKCRHENPTKQCVKAECELQKIIDSAPTIDAAPVVRCKECKWRCDFYGYGIYFCGKLGVDCPGDADYSSDCEFFCKYGERRKKRD